MNERAAIRDTTLPRGGGLDGQSPVFVAKGTQVLIPTYSMQHREDIWGPDVDQYKPSRWIGRKFGWDFIPFGGGARQCIGREFPPVASHSIWMVLTYALEQFAHTKVMFIVVRMLQTFDKIENMEAPGPIRMHHTIENKSGTGVQVRLHRAHYAQSKRAESSSEHSLGVERNQSVS